MLSYGTCCAIAVSQETACAVLQFDRSMAQKARLLLLLYAGPCFPSSLGKLLIAHLWRHPVRCANYILMQFIIVLFFELA